MNGQESGFTDLGIQCIAIVAGCAVLAGAGNGGDGAIKINAADSVVVHIGQVKVAEGIKG